MTHRPAMALLLRGHVRDAFQNDKMRHFVQMMQQDDRLSVDVYVQTWNHNEAPANCSWRSLNYDRTPVTDEMVHEYLRGASRVRVMPEDGISLVGSVEGMVGGTSKRGWKQMWLGIYTMVDAICEAGVSYDAVLSLRFDFFGSYVSGRHRSDYGVDATPEYVREWAVASARTGRVCFLNDHPSLGIDNCYIGPPTSIHRLCFMFHTDLDATCDRVGHEWNQERMVYKLGMMINADPDGDVPTTHADESQIDPPASIARPDG